MAERKRSKAEQAEEPIRRGLSRRVQHQLNTLMDEEESAKVLVSQVLALCPLPFRQPKTSIVERKTQTGLNESVTVTFSATRKRVGLPFGSDAVLLDMLCSEARRQKSREITFERASQIMELLGLDPNEGPSRRQTLERLERLTHLVIDVELPNGFGYKLRVIDARNLPSKKDLAREKKGERPLIPYGVRFSEEFEHFMLPYMPIPERAVVACKRNPTEYALLKRIFHRVAKAGTESVIPWQALWEESGSGDSNERRFRAKVRELLKKLKTAWPELHQAVTPTTRGLAVKRIRGALD